MDTIDKKKVNVEIYNKTYTIVGTESAQHVRQVADIVDDKMHEIKKLNQSLDPIRLAVLTAVNITNDYIKLQEKYMELEGFMKEKEDK